MKALQRLVLLTLLLVVAVATYGNSPEVKHSLMPVPKEVKWNEGKFRLNKDFFVAAKGNIDERLYKASTRFLRRLDNRTGLFFKQANITEETSSDSANMIISCEESAAVKLGEDESYKLIITEKSIELKSKYDVGALRGIETLLQMLQADEEGYYFPECEINDAPRFPWRGLMIDVARHFLPIDVIKRNIDGMAAVKLNVLHLHLSDDQGFRVESKLFPKLHLLASDGDYFTYEDIKEIVRYADERGIRVIPEFDLPGHATCWFKAYPEFASAKGEYDIERCWGVFDPTMNPTDEGTYKFLDGLFGEMASLFKDEYFHIGGDEHNGKQWNANEDIQKFMQERGIEDNHALQAYFNNHLLKILTKHHKKMIGWDEILHPQMPNTIVIQSWRGTKALEESARKGYKGILSNGYYIDLIKPTTAHYLNDPIPEGSTLTEEEKKNILGGEATQWAELITPENVDSRIWPRMAAIAERFWSPQEVKDIDDMYRRMERISFLLEEHGLTHNKNYEMMLRRLTNNNDIEPLRKLIDVLEPVKVYDRHSQGVKYKQYSPYTRIVDAARPDQKVAREFRKMVSEFCAENKVENKERILKSLTEWKNNHKALEKTFELSPITREAKPLSENLSKISEIGLTAMELIEKGSTADSEWKSNAAKIIEAAKLPYGQAELMIVTAIEELVNKI